jgi:hypothetical protein
LLQVIYFSFVAEFHRFVLAMTNDARSRVPNARLSQYASNEFKGMNLRICLLYVPGVLKLKADKFNILDVSLAAVLWCLLL